MIAAPVAASDACSRRSAGGLSATAISAPTAAPANTNPAHGNSVKVVRSPTGLTYHCNQVGRVATSGLDRTIGVSSAAAAAAAPSSAARPAADDAAPHSSAAATIDG